ncbi:abhydrolase domain-containing protein [Neofusicoccum parvum]|uniref:Abhydrolase domain-containing protein n=1 Tax=Neofusicoccum parvum TaxID=310453 RepID=A0ACB5SIB1_9PEZI|nr:abhydrolase domain-containing protein [Neofusicoccum parvum]GME46185.1 abhydrolase domain-containing protein [Neofusicoccum parvum]
MPAPPKQRKIAIVGSRSVGTPSRFPLFCKSSLTVQFVDGHFVESYYPTIENTFSKVIRYKGVDYATEIIDTAGQDEYSILNSKHFIGIHGYMIVYSVGHKQTFEMARIIRDKILNHLGTEWVPLVIVGNKSDLRPEQRQVTAEQGKALAEEFKCAWTEASARYNENVSRAFDHMIGEIEKSQNPGEPTAGGKCTVMLARHAILRPFSTSRPLARLDLSYDLHEPPKGSATSVSENAPIIILHGLFGSKRNNRSISKQLTRDLNRPIYAVDLRNHGDSPHDPRHDYTALAEDMEDFIEHHKLSGSTLIGHSMGAKTVMAVALRRPELVRDVIPVDNAPVDAALKSDFGKYVQGMKKVDAAKPKRQSDADAIMKPFAEELPVRQFLLSNLVRAPGNDHLQFKIPVAYLANALDNMADFPFKDPEATRFNKPALFIRGTKSHYVPDETMPIIGRFFPLFKMKDVESGHWVVSENPEGFRQAVLEFLQDQE